MRISQCLRDMSRYLPVLAVLAATVVGLFLGKDMYPVSGDPQPRTPASFVVEPKEPQLWLAAGTAETCFSSLIYTSLPPKCKTLDGKFIVMPGTSPYFVVIPERK